MQDFVQFRLDVGAKLGKIRDFHLEDVADGFLGVHRLEDVVTGINGSTSTGGMQQFIAMGNGAGRATCKERAHVIALPWDWVAKGLMMAAMD